MNIDKSTRKWIALMAFGLVLASFSLNNFNSLVSAYKSILAIFTPFIMGAAIAFIINTPMKSIESFIKSIAPHRNAPWIRTVSLILALLLIIVIIFFVFKTVIPELTNAIIGAANNLPKVINDVTAWANKVFDDSIDASWLQQVKTFLNQMSTDAVNWLNSSMSSLLQEGLSIIFSTFSSALNFIVAFAFSLFLLGDKEKHVAQAYKIINAFFKKSTADTILVFSYRANIAFSNFLTGQCLEAVIYGTLAFLLMNIFRFPYATTISILVTFTALIPYFGGFIGTAIGAILIFTMSPFRSLTFIIMITILQQIEGNFIYPRVVGKSVGLPGIWVMSSVVIGGSISGLIGMLIAVPLASVLYTTFRDIVNYKLAKKDSSENSLDFPSYLKQSYINDLKIMIRNKENSILKKLSKL